MLTKADWAAIKKENGEHLKNEFLEEAKKKQRETGCRIMRQSVFS